MAKKKVVGYGMLALGIAQLALSLAEHSPGRKVAAIEVFGALLFLSAGAVLYATDAHKTVVSTSRALYKRTELGGIDALNYAVARFLRKLSEIMYKRLELGGLDAFNYLVAEYVVKAYQVFRKTHTGVLSWNMILIMLGATLMLILLIQFGGGL